MLNDEFMLIHITVVWFFTCRVPGKSYCSDCRSSMHLFKNEENLEQ